MSENNRLPAPEPTTDLTDKDLAVIEQYKLDGLPNIASVDDEKLTKIMDLYLSGKTYRQISMTLNVDKRIILYMSQKFDWFQLKKDYIEDLEKSIRGRLVESKVINQDFLLQLQHMWQKKIGGKIQKYLATGEGELSEMDLKQIEKYFKTVEMLQKLSANPQASATQAIIGLNMGEGMTVVKKGDNEIEITPKSKAIGDMLREVADSRRIEEAVPNKKSDNK